MESQQEQANNRPEKGEADVRRRAPRRGLRWFLAGAGIALAAGAFLYWRHVSGRESTDDAQIDGHIHAVSARVGGHVVRVLVDNNQFVQAGQVLVEIDPKDYQVAIDKAKADLAEAQAMLHASTTNVPIVSTTTASQISGANAGVLAAQADVSVAEKQVDASRARLRSFSALVRQAQANYERAARDLDRMKALVAKEEVSQQQFDAARAAAEASRAQVDSAEAQVREAEEGVRVARSQLEQKKARLAKAESDAQAARTGPQQVSATRARAESSSAKVLQMKATLEQAELNLQYTVVRAPVSGVVGQKAVETGQTVQAAQPLLAVVALEDVWVTANFKENQLADIRPGQRAEISVDAYGGRTYRGHVDSIAAATGARFSLLPPENATGNYVKVVQRIPVKIVFEKGQDPEHLLRPGMSVEPKVFTR